MFVGTRNISGDFLDFIERMFNVVVSARNISEDFLDLLERTFNEFVSGTYISDDFLDLEITFTVVVSSRKNSEFSSNYWKECLKCLLALEIFQ